MQGFRTHVSDPKINTICTNTLKNIQDTLWSAPSRPSILVIHAQLFYAFSKFPTTAVQSLSPTIMTHTRYLNDSTL